ncbi:uncharacterized protein LOC116131096 [Pistacia vera]|uniref:uncharacterized protein LOC116130724 n=1 Tax=Pistacia vera TaxID=55513 RepID=UPI001262FFEA|nr:uncharacterized protein LOC116130724 [Pistacia vera]XP_031272597.1 uncharacterized protein LOC116131096 [Pistacia vera]
MADLVKELAVPIQLADFIVKAADEAYSFKQECQELKSKAEKLAALLRQVARTSNVPYQRPTLRIAHETEQVLDKTLTLVVKCRGNGIVKRVFTIIPAAAFKKSSMQLENCLGDVSWLLRVSASGEDHDDEYLGLPPIAANEPILCLIWEQISILYTGSFEEKSDGAASLVSLARDNDRYGKLIIEEGGVPPLLKLAKEGEREGQENAARAIGLLGRDAESVEQIVNAGVCAVFAKILKDGHMKVQSVVAWAVSELVGNHRKCQEHFAQNNIVRFLVSHLAFETVQEHSKYTISTHKQPMSSIHSVLVASNTTKDPNNEKNQTTAQYSEENFTKVAHPMGNQAPSSMSNLVSDVTQSRKLPNNSKSTQQQQRHPTNQHQQANDGRRYNNNTKQHNHQHQGQVSLAVSSIHKGRESESPALKAEMKAMAARALWQLSKESLTICRNLTESRALLCFAVLLEKGHEDVQSYSAMALVEITAVAEKNAELRRSAFKPTSPAAKAVVEQLLHVIERADSDLLIPCIKCIGNLARTFRATETRFIRPLVKLLDESEPEVAMEAIIALNKFATTQNFLCDVHSKAIISAGGTKHLIQHVYFGEQMIQIPALMLLCYVAMNVPDSETLAEEEVLIVLEWSLKQAHLTAEPSLESLLPEANSRLKLYQSRGTRGFH